MFDALGKPWPVHSCWKEHCEERNYTLFSVKTDLIVAGYNGRFYKPTGKKCTHPVNSELSIAVDGYVADNHVWYQPGKITFLRSSRGASSAPLVKIEIADSNESLFPFLVPESTARLIDDYELISVKGLWIKRGRRWLLFATELSIYMPGKRKGAILTGIPFLDPFVCSLCGESIPETGSWGLDAECNFECSFCGKARGKLAPREFIDHCYKVVERNDRISDV